MRLNRGLNDRQNRALLEISNIGMGHAATALSQLIGETVELRVSRITLTGTDRLSQLFGGTARKVAGIRLQMLGEARGMILLTFPDGSARSLLTRLLGGDRRKRRLDELGISTLKEVGNILASAYLTALSGLLGLTLIPSVPSLSYDTAAAVLDPLLGPLPGAEERALVVETEFHTPREGSAAIGGHFFLLPEVASLQRLLAALERA